MAVGDIVSDIQTLPASGTALISSTAGQEWVIHTLVLQSSAEISLFDGTNAIPMDVTPLTGQWYDNLQEHVNTTRFLRLKSLTPGAQLYGFTGVQTK